MSTIKRWTLRHRAAILVAALIALATVALAAGRTNQARPLLPPDEESTASADAQQLAAPLPPPAQVFIQRTSQFPNLGNVLVSVQLTADEIAAKSADGTQDFVTIGSPDALVILRDDGIGGDSVAGDGIYTGIAMLDDATLMARYAADQSALAAHSGATVPVFAGRVSIGTTTPVSFDWNSYNAGQRVAFNPAVVFLGAESTSNLQQQQPPAADQPPLLSPRGLVSSSQAAFVAGTDAFQEHVLMIRDLSVVNDPARTWSPCNGGNPNGVWTFNHLMTNNANMAASGIDPAAYTRNWINTWGAPPTINGHVVSNRNPALILNNWPKKADGVTLDLTKSPFRLLAIVPRVDLRRTTGGGGALTVNTSGNFIDGGEARFVFGLETGACAVQPFAVIFEYRVPKCGCPQVKAWAQQWVALAAMPFGAAYNMALQNITEQYARPNANPARPNGSALGQQRTDEIALAPPLWELREFQLTQFPFSMLNETTTADTPLDAFNGAVLFQNWVQGSVEPAIHPPGFQQPIPPVPLFSGVPGVSFLGSNPQEPPAPPVTWSAPGLNLAILAENWARERASLASCSGCHTGETGTPFTHVDPRTGVALRAALSGFLTGITVPDPVAPGHAPARDFDDLARRELDIQQVAGMSCSSMPTVSVSVVQAAIVSTGHLPSDLFAISGTVPESRMTMVGVDDMRRNLVTEVH